MPITMMFAADQIGRSYRDYVTDYRVLGEGQRSVAAEYDIDYVSCISDPARESRRLRSHRAVLRRPAAGHRGNGHAARRQVQVEQVGNPGSVETGTTARPGPSRGDARRGTTITE